MDDKEKKISLEFGDRLKNNVVLRDHVSMKVGGVADYFLTAETIEDLVHAVSFSYKIGLPYFVLGGGYNVIPSDLGFPGLVIHNKSSNIVFANDSSQVIADSGVNLATLINLAAGRDLGGLEFLFGVPGTVGGAIYGNAGAFGSEIGVFVKSLTILMPKEGQMVVVKHSANWMNFSYRKSILKKEYAANDFKPVILTARLQLVQRRRDEITKVIRENLRLKKINQPLEEHSSGSFFMNPGLGREMSAGFLLDQAGAKRIKVGGASFSKKHANFLINSKNATANDVRLLANQAKDLVENKFDVRLKEEIEYIGTWSEE